MLSCDDLSKAVKVGAYGGLALSMGKHAHSTAGRILFSTHPVSCMAVGKWFELPGTPMGEEHSGKIHGGACQVPIRE